MVSEILALATITTHRKIRIATDEFHYLFTALVAGYKCWEVLFTKINLFMQAAKRSLKYPRYTWIAYDWYPREWWKDISGSDYSGDCDTEMLEQFLERVISLRRYPAPDNSSVVTDAGIVSN